MKSMSCLFGFILCIVHVASAWTHSPASKEIGVNGGSFTLIVSGTEYYDWYAGSDADWITVTRVNATTFTIAIAPNDTSEVRGANVTINAFQGGATPSAQTWVNMRNCGITQAAKATGGEEPQTPQETIVVGVTPSTLSVGAEGTVTNVEIRTTGAWNVENSLPWISVDRVSGTGNGSLTVTIAGNEARQYRFGTFVVGGQAVHVTQNGRIEPCGVTNVVARQRYPYSGKVDIDYYVQGNIRQNAQDAGYLVSLEVSAENVQTGARYVAKELAGELSLSDGKHSIVWDMEKQGISFQSDQVVFSVSCKTQEALYCIVDLSSGAGTTSYPIVYTNEIPGGSWSDEYKTSKLVLRRIEAGRFGVYSLGDIALPTNTLTRPYYIGVFELTYGQCCLIRSETTPPLYLADLDAPPNIDWDSVCRKYPMTISYDQLRGANLGSHWPLTTDVDEGSIVAALRNRTGLMFDLPTCSQWVCAYRAGTDTEFYWGNAPRHSGSDELMNLYAWNWGNTRNGTSADLFGGVHGVGLKLPNAWGLHDMTGNVWEWNLDYFAEDAGYMLLTGSEVRQYYCGVDPVGPVKECSDTGRRCMAGGAIQDPVDMPTAGEVAGWVSSEVGWTTGARLVVNLKSDQVGMVSSESMSEIVVLDTVNLTYAPAISAEADGANFICVIGWESDWPIYYTMDGSEPTVRSLLYNGEIVVGAKGGKTIKAIAISPAGEQSEVATLEILSPNPPTISPADRTIIGSSVSVNIASDNPNATIYYTTDGTEPTTDSPVYSRFKTSKKMTVKAIAVVDGMAWSETATAEYALGQCADPIITPADGTVFGNSNYQVSITKKGEKGVLRYTTDGSDPTETSPVYSGPFTISETTTIKAKTFDTDYFDSAVVVAMLTRQWTKVATPVVVAPERFSGTKIVVSLTCATEGAVIRYTTDGSVPNSHSSKYMGAFEVTGTTTVKAIALKTDCTTSDVATLTIAKEWCIGDALNDPDRQFVTDGVTGWGRDTDVSHDGTESMRSGAIVDSVAMGVYSTSTLSTVVEGKGVVRFWWRASCEEDEEFEWDHGEFRVDGVAVVKINGESGWKEFSYDIMSSGNHTLAWVYCKDDFGKDGEDCLWLDEVSWTPSQQGVVVPAEVTGGKKLVVDESWPMSLDAQFGAGTRAAFVEKFGSDLSAALLKSTGKKSAAGEDMYVWQDYVAGTDPTDPKSQFTAKIEMVDGKPVVVWSPKLSEAEAAKRIYTTYGKKTLEAGEPWTPVETPAQGGWRFFKVGVEMR